MPQVSIVIPNWNGAAFLADCLSSLGQQAFRDFEVLVVDNGSSDESAAICAQAKVTWIPLTTNTGFAHAVNVGIEHARGELVFLLNNDTTLHPECLARLVSYADTHPEVGMFASAMLQAKRPEYIDSFGDCLTREGRSYNRGRNEKDTGQYASGPVFGPCAGAGLYRAEVFQKIGMFDERFFAYLEDVDVAARAQLVGITCHFVAQSYVYHVGSGTSTRISGFTVKQRARNQLWLLIKNFPSRVLMRQALRILFSELRYAGASLRDGVGIAYVHGIFLGLGGLRHAVRERWRIQRLQDYHPSGFEAALEDSYQFQPINWKRR